MPKAVTIAEVTGRIGAIIDSVATEGAEVIVAANGEPRAVIIGYAEYQRFEALRERERRREAGETLRRVRDQVSAANVDMSDDERTSLADRAVRDAVAGLVAKSAFRPDE